MTLREAALQAFQNPISWVSIIAGVLIINYGHPIGLADELTSYVLVGFVGLMVFVNSMSLYVKGLQGNISHQLLWFLFLNATLVGVVVLSMIAFIVIAVMGLKTNLEIIRITSRLLMMVTFLSMMIVNNSMHKSYSFKTMTTYIVLATAAAGLSYFVLRLLFSAVIPAN